jgi:hypothetical protein
MHQIGCRTAKYTAELEEGNNQLLHRQGAIISCEGREGREGREGAK